MKCSVWVRLVPSTTEIESIQGMLEATCGG
jgi:hypothetical protein